MNIKVTKGQLEYEFTHLMRKLKVRDIKLYKELGGTKTIHSHPIFKVVPGEIEDWEIVG